MLAESRLQRKQALGYNTPMQSVVLKVEKRDVLGKKVKKLRKSGVLPANVYGKDVESVAVQIPTKEFEATFKQTGETGLIELHIGSEKKPVLIHNVQYDYVTHEPVHADFYQVNLKEKIKTMVPVVLVGEPKAIADKLGLLMHLMHEVEVEALPTDLPEKIEVDVTNLAAVDDQITVADLKKPAGVEILTDGGELIAKIGELVSKEAEAQAAAEQAAQAEAKAEGAEGETAEAAAATEEAKTPTEAPKEEAKK